MQEVFKMKLRFQKLTAQNIRAVWQISREVMTLTEDPYPYSSTDYDKFVEKVSHGTAIVASLKNMVVGALIYYPSYNSKDVIEFEVFISKKYQRLGIGQKLITQMINDASTHNIKRINLDVLSTNPVAIKFYENLGFTRFVTEKNRFFINNRYVNTYKYFKIIN